MFASRVSIPFVLLASLVACTSPPAPARLTLHKDACQEPGFTPLVPTDEFLPTPIPVLAGGTVVSGDFVISLWLYCDPSLSSDDPDLPGFSEVRYLGFRSEWQYLGRPIDHMSRTVITVNGEQVSSSGSGPGVASREINVHMGETRFPGLADALRALGMTDAFDPAAADFTGISVEEELYVSDVIHEAFIAVDEDGTEAAAATAVIIGTTSAPVEVVELTVDRPFLFFLQDRATGAVLFMGRVVNPVG